MASAFSHAVAALSLGTCFYRPGMPKRLWMAGALCSVLPDIDVIGFHFGIHYGDFWGHRGFTHSLPFAVILANFVARKGFSFARITRSGSPFDLELSVFGHRQPRLSRRHDRRKVSASPSSLHSTMTAIFFPGAPWWLMQRRPFRVASSLRSPFA